MSQDNNWRSKALFGRMGIINSNNSADHAALQVLRTINISMRCYIIILLNYLKLCIKKMVKNYFDLVSLFKEMLLFTKCL